MTRKPSFDWLAPMLCASLWFLYDMRPMLSSPLLIRSVPVLCAFYTIHYAFLFISASCLSMTDTEEQRSWVKGMITPRAPCGYSPLASCSYVRQSSHCSSLCQWSSGTPAYIDNTLGSSSCWVLCHRGKACSTFFLRQKQIQQRLGWLEVVSFCYMALQTSAWQSTCVLPLPLTVWWQSFSTSTVIFIAVSRL